MRAGDVRQRERHLVREERPDDPAQLERRRGEGGGSKRVEERGETGHGGREEGGREVKRQGGVHACQHVLNSEDARLVLCVQRKEGGTL